MDEDLIKALYISAIVVLLIAFGPAAPYWGVSSGYGDATDPIQGVQLSGMIWKTYEVYQTNDHGLANSDWNGIFTVNKNDQKLIEQLQKASQTYDKNGNKQKVKIYYQQHRFVNPQEYSCRTVITRMEIIDEQNFTEKG